MLALYNNKVLIVISNMSVTMCLLKTSKSLQTKTAPAVTHLAVVGQVLNNNNNNYYYYYYYYHRHLLHATFPLITFSFFC